jgi:hypothetical protein
MGNGAPGVAIGGARCHDPELLDGPRRESVGENHPVNRVARLIEKRETFRAIDQLWSEASIGFF